MPVELKEVYQPDVEQKMRNVYNSLSEKDRRRYAAAEVAKLGHGGTAYIARLFECRRSSIELRGIRCEKTSLGTGRLAAVSGGA